MAANPVGKRQLTPAPITPNVGLTSPQIAALNALQTARATFETANIGAHLAEVNVLLFAIDTCLLAMV
jgi:hypothetical protein